MNRTASDPEAITRTLLYFDVAAGPLYVGVGAIEAFAREGSTQRATT